MKFHGQKLGQLESWVCPSFQLGCVRKMEQTGLEAEDRMQQIHSQTMQINSKPKVRDVIYF